MAVLALLLLYLSNSLFVEAQPIQYNLAHVTTESCLGPLPTVEFSLRTSIDGDDNIPQEFTEWTLVQYYTGNCSQDQTLITSQPNPGTQYQFRVEMTPASSCHCVTLTNITQPFGSVLPAWTSGEFWCGTNQSLPCAADDKVTRFLSRVVNVTDNSNIQIAACGDNHLSTSNTSDLAIAYDGVFGTCPEAQCFSLSPLQQNNAHVNISFSLILDLDIPPDCRKLCNANEGILLRADSSISTAYLSFYYNLQKIDKHVSRVPQLQFLDEGRISLSYDNLATNIKVPGTFNNNTGLQMYNLSNSQIINRVVRIKWEQHTQTPHKGDCDTVSLDSTAVSLNWNQCVRNVLHEDFDDQQALGWTLFQVNVSNEAQFCASYPCLYFVGVNRTTSTSARKNVRFSNSPLLDLRIVKAVKPPPASVPTILVNSTECSNGQKWLMVSFQLVMTHFQYPTPCNEQDNTPKGVMMTVSKNTPLAYFAPLANDNWNQFTRESMLFNTNGIDVPILLPVHNQLTKVSVCIDDFANEEFVEVVWRQDNFASNQNYWYLHIEQLLVDDMDISNITQAGGNNYNLSLTNGGNLNPTNCDISSSTHSFFGLTGSNSQSPRAVTITVSLTTVSSSPLPTMSSSSSMSDATTVAILPTSTVAVVNSSTSASFSKISSTSTVAVDTSVSSTSVVVAVNTSLTAISSTAAYNSSSTIPSTSAAVNPVIPSTAFLDSSLAATASSISTNIDSSTISFSTYLLSSGTAVPFAGGMPDRMQLVVILIVVFVTVGVVLLIVLVLIVLITILKYKQRKSPVQQKPVQLEKISHESESYYPATNLDKKPSEAETKMSEEKGVEEDTISPSQQSSPSHNSTVPLTKPLQDDNSVKETGLVHSGDDPTKKYPARLQVIPSRTEIDSPAATGLASVDSEEENDKEPDEISFCSHEDQLVYINFSSDDDKMQQPKLNSKTVSCSHHKHH